MTKPQMPLGAVLTLATTLLGAWVPAHAADEATPGGAPATPPAASAPEMPVPPMPSQPTPGAMEQMPWEGPMGGPGRMGPGPMRGGPMGPMRQMRQQHWAEMQAHQRAMETHLANIEALLRELINLQKAGK